MAIKESEKKYREAIENIDLGLMEVDNDETILFANDPFLNATGYTLKEVIGKNAREVFLNAEDRAYHKALLEQTAALRTEDKSSAYELPIRSKWGERLWFLISGTPLKDYEGNVIGSLGIHHNISNIKKLQAQLEYRTEFQNTLLNLASKLIDIETDKESDVINDALSKIGQFVGADRAYIFDYLLEEGITNNLFEWCAEGISLEIENLQAVPLETIPDWPEAHRKGEAMLYKDISLL